MGKLSAAAVLDAVRLAIAVLLYMVIEPKCVQLVSPAPAIFGTLLAAVVAAVATLLLAWLVNPFSRIDVLLKNVYTRQSVAGPTHPITATPHNPVAARFVIELRVTSRGLLARGVLSRARKAGPRVEVSFDSFTTTLGTWSTSDVIVETSQGVSLAPRSIPSSDGTWSWCAVDLGVGSLPASGLDASVSVGVSYGSKLFFLYRWMVRASCPVRILRIN